MARAFLTGDINLMHVGDLAVPRRQGSALLGEADAVFSNLECMLHRSPHTHAVEHEGFFADPDIGAAVLKQGYSGAAGMANDINYGEEAILGSLSTLTHGIPHAPRLAVLPGHTAYEVPTYQYNSAIPR
ncbi:hypothetical protein DY245_09795 [Streptomyces inhibens]|uniref:Metallophosphoesterase n=1 Tax=Streptomyces inhibens TaxID=2293571 RepID=A0A371Q6X3_STRIH|nr:hypothetical protein [Streptomyces inhibens]REK90454.1 hypothetical protein DY245_09795 [Streptomyces inhibens]